MRTFRCLALAVILLLAAAGAGAAGAAVRVMAAGRLLPPGVLIEGVTYIPLRAAAEALGARVEWDGESRTVTLTPLVTAGELAALRARLHELESLYGPAPGRRGPQVEVVGWAQYRSRGNRPRAAVEVRNAGDAPAGQIRIELVAWDHAGTVLATGAAGLPAHLVLGPGERAAAELDLTTAIPDEAQVEVTATALAAPPAAEALRITVEGAALVSGSGGSLHAVGVLKNSGDSTLRQVKPMVTFYDAQGRVLAAGSAAASLAALAPGATLAFDIPAPRTARPVASFSVRTAART